MNEISFDALIDRIRNSCLFYMKGDVLVLGGLVTLYATYRFDSPYAFLTISTFKFQFVCALLALFFGVIFEGILTTSQASADVSSNLKRAKTLKRIYFSYIAIQGLALSLVSASFLAFFLMEAKGL
ncbi:MAG: hypothetical protein WCA63_12920 [Gallionella sp.]